MTETITSSVIAVTVAGQTPYGLVCAGGYYRCVSGAGTLTLSECEASPDYATKC